MIYIDNRPSITRSSNQKEDIKVILQFWVKNHATRNKSQCIPIFWRLW
jgi:hypothetical protein